MSGYNINKDFVGYVKEYIYSRYPFVTVEFNISVDKIKINVTYFFRGEGCWVLKVIDGSMIEQIDVHLKDICMEIASKMCEGE